MHAADGLAHFIVGGRSYGAGVENDQSGFRGRRNGREALCSQAGFDGGSVGLGGSAAEIFYEESIHCIYRSWSIASKIFIEARQIHRSCIRSARQSMPEFPVSSPCWPWQGYADTGFAVVFQVVMTSRGVMKVESSASERSQHVFRFKRRKPPAHADSGMSTRISSLTVLSEGIGK